MKNKLLLVLVLAAVAAQAQVFHWARNATSTYANVGIGVCKVPGGAIGQAGAYQSALSIGSFTLPNAGQSDMYIAKYDVYGNVLWAVNAGGTGDDGIADIDNDKYGNFYVTGRFDSPVLSFGTQSISCSGTNDGFLAKYNGSGSLVWLKHFTGPGFESGAGVSVDTLGNVYVTGESTSTVFVIGTQTLNMTISGDMFTAKYDNNGNFIWVSKAAGIYQDEPLSLSTDNAGNAYITGRSISPILTAGSVSYTFSPSFSPTGARYYLLKYDANGVAQWIRGSMDNSDGHNVDTDINGDVYVTGDFSSPTMVLGTYTLPLSGTWSGFIAKYDGNGNVLWAKRPISNYCFGYGLAANNTGVYLTGPAQFPIVFGNDTLNAPANSFLPMWLVKFDPAGNEVCTSVFNNGIGDGTDLATDNTDFLYITGNFLNSPLVQGNYTLTPGITNTMFLTKFSCACLIEGFSAGSSNVISCEGQPVTFTATGAPGYTWSTGSQTSSIVVNPFSTTSYTVNASGPQDCVASLVITQSVSACTGWADHALTAGILVYPNPGSGLFKVNASQLPADAEFVLYDLTGRQIYIQQLKSTDLNLEGFTKGLYTYTIRKGLQLIGSGRLSVQ